MPFSVLETVFCQSARVWGFGIVFFMHLGLYSAFAQSQVISLEDAINQALMENNLVKAGQYDLKQAEWNRKNAWTLWLPSASLNSRMMRIDDQTFAERDFRRYLPPALRDQIPQTVFQQSYFTSVDVTMPLFNSAILNGLSIAHQNVKMSRSHLKSTRQNTIFLTLRSYLNVVKTRQVLQLQTRFLEFATLNLQKAERMFNAGRYARLDLLRYQMDLQQQENIVVNTRSALRSELTTLKRMINIPHSQLITVSDSLPESVWREGQKIEQLSEAELLQMIELNDKELIELNATLAAAQANKELSRLFHRESYLSFLPTVNISYSYGWRENNTPALDDYSPKTFMVNLSVPLFSGLQKITALRSSYYAYQASQERFQDQLQNTRLLLTETVNRLLNLKAQRPLIRTTVEYNQNNFDIVTQQRDQGLLSHIDYLDAQLQHQQAGLDQIQLEYDYITAVIELYYLLSKLDAVF